jgi:hypothetical protein
MPAIANANIFLYVLIGLAVLIIILIAVIIGAATRRPRTPQAAKPVKATTPPRPRLQEILRLSRDPDTGRVVSEFQGRIIRDPHTLSKVERDYLVRLAKDWYTWLGIPEPQPAAQSEASLAASAAPTVPDAPVAPATESISAEPVAPAYPQVDMPLPHVAPAPPAAVAAELLQSPIPRSIVQQVDDIVQEKVAAHPGPIPSIKLAEDPYEGVIVWVNQTKFVGIESVTDPVVRAIIRSAAVEWEHRTEK